MKIAVLLLFLSITAQAVQMIDIRGSDCNAHLRDDYGILVSYVCVDRGEAYVCADKERPYGMKIPNDLYKKFAIDKRNPDGIKAACFRDKKAKVDPIAKNCKLSDHSLFKPLFANIGVQDPHSCFCKSKNGPVLSSCVQIDGEWKSTSEFIPEVVRSKLHKTCQDQSDPSYQIACHCDQFGADPKKHIECLKKNTKGSSSRGTKKPRAGN